MQTLPHDAASLATRRCHRTALARTARALPYALFAGAGIWWAHRSPSGRKAVEFDWQIEPHDVAQALTKVPHIQWMAVTFLLAVLAVGVGRAGTAALMTLAVGLGWEIAETTVPAHHARLVDLVPDLAGIMLGYLLLRLGHRVLPLLSRAVLSAGRTARSPQ